MWWLFALVIGGYLVFVAWQFSVAMIHLVYLIIRDAICGETK